MRKYIYIIIFLIISIILSFSYLNQSITGKRAYEYIPSNNFYLLQKRKIVLNEIKDFSFDEFFMILSKSPVSYRYEFSEDRLLIHICGKDFSYPYEIRPEKIIETTVYEEVIKEVPVYIDRPGADNTPYLQNDDRETEDYEEEYFYLMKDHFTFPQGTKIAEIIDTIRDSIKTNQTLSVDYSLLNPNQIGQYPLFVLKNDGKTEIFVFIV
ncbi:MAG: hypothetical protein K5648_08105 [Erysipelotrichaceae bacterium]|nr:hypothetical protein [Erysipelotrichaceae bacterium]